MNDQESIVQLKEPLEKKESLFQLDVYIFIDVLVIFILVALVFGRTLTNYFLADDFGEIHYIARIFQGDLALFFANFTGNYMQIPGMSVYRPFLLLSLMFDFLFWRGNAFGYYLTNVCFYFFDACLLYFIVGSLSQSCRFKKSRLTALVAAALFAVSPLHCESVSWILGRVDIVCAFFYLISLMLMLKSCSNGNRKLTYLSIAAYLSALLVKEMAIGIPLLAFMVGYLYKEKSSNFSSGANLKNALVFCLPYFVATCAYFLVRYLCLGTLVGGYVAGFGASQETNLVARWFDADTIKRMAFPLVLEHFSNENSISILLIVLYSMTAAIFAIRLAARQVPLKLFLFLSVWAMSTLIPIYKLWGLGYHLEGARFIFFFTMPLAALFAALLFQDTGIENETAPLARPLTAVSSAVAICSLAVYGCVAAKTNQIWVNAGKEVRATAASARRLLAEAGQKPAIFLGIPKEWKGSHMILNGDTFRATVNPPFSNVSPRRQYATFEPIMYSPVHDIDVPRLKSLVAGGASVYVWSPEKREFLPRQYEGSGARVFDRQSDEGHIETAGLCKQTKDALVLFADRQQKETPGIYLSGLNLNPLLVDFLAVELKTRGLEKDSFVSASWKEGKDISNEADAVSAALPGASAGFETVYLPLSRRWTWFQNNQVERIFLSFPRAGEVEVRSLSLLEESSVAPRLSLENARANENGCYITDLSDVQLSIDASRLNGARSLILEISKPNYFFDNFRQAEGAEAVASKIPLAGTAAKIRLRRDMFKGRGFFQMRALAIGKNNKPILERSSPLTLQLR